MKFILFYYHLETVAGMGQDESNDNVEPLLLNTEECQDGKHGFSNYIVNARSLIFDLYRP